jgi:hypothetical protein
MKNSHGCGMNIMWFKSNRTMKVGKPLALDALKAAVERRSLTRRERRALESLTKPRKRA